MSLFLVVLVVLVLVLVLVVWVWVLVLMMLIVVGIVVMYHRLAILVMPRRNSQEVRIRCGYMPREMRRSVVQSIGSVSQVVMPRDLPRRPGHAEFEVHVDPRSESQPV
jgi:hypothetical protein